LNSRIKRLTAENVHALEQIERARIALRDLKINQNIMELISKMHIEANEFLHESIARKKLQRNENISSELGMVEEAYLVRASMGFQLGLIKAEAEKDEETDNDELFRMIAAFHAEEEESEECCDDECSVSSEDWDIAGFGGFEEVGERVTKHDLRDGRWVPMVVGRFSTDIIEDYADGLILAERFDCWDPILYVDRRKEQEWVAEQERLLKLERKFSARVKRLATWVRRKMGFNE
jgi:hypothetical protein